ncbi:uncharacterized protein LOC121297901 [Polyodon spathula]|uniref:uncharacterized protein LOC121297901 n=1 Tax=Polyodon spathula TaxID=7913 RepID=UPI001B7F01C7|nr:uncharacterized protein LOC121297901 [Polyodon spathula]XP_041080461.1 uncharacterized protein LOC121297901 [Polyodon spathula]
MKTCTTLDFTRQASGEEAPVQPAKAEDVQLKQSESPENKKSRAIKQNLVTREEWLRLTKNSYSAINSVRTAAVKTCTTLDFTRQASGEKTPVQPAKAEDVQLKQSESPENKKSRAIKQNLVTREEWLRLTKNSYSAINSVRTAAMKTCTTLDFTRQASEDEAPVQPAKAEDVQLKQSESPENKNFRAIKQNLVTLEEWLRLTKNSYSAINPVRTAAMKTCTTLDFTRQASGEEAPVQPAKAEDVQLKQSESPKNKKSRAIKQNLVTLEEWLRITKNSFSQNNSVNIPATVDCAREASQREAPVHPVTEIKEELRQLQAFVGVLQNDLNRKQMQIKSKYQALMRDWDKDDDYHRQRLKDSPISWLGSEYSFSSDEECERDVLTPSTRPNSVILDDAEHLESIATRGEVQLDEVTQKPGVVVSPIEAGNYMKCLEPTRHNTDTECQIRLSKAVNLDVKPKASSILPHPCHSNKTVIKGGDSEEESKTSFRTPEEHVSPGDNVPSVWERICTTVFKKGRGKEKKQGVKPKHQPALRSIRKAFVHLCCLQTCADKRGGKR